MYCTTALHPTEDVFFLALSPVHKHILAPLSTVTWQVLPPTHVLNVTGEPENHYNDDEYTLVMIIVV